MITFDHVSLRYDDDHRPALDDVSFEVAQGEFAFLVGASGSGKSSLLHLMTRELVPTEGRVEIHGRQLHRMRRRHIPALRRDIGVVFQDFRLLENKTVHENVAFVLEILGRRAGAIRRAVPESLEMVGLAEKGHRFPHELSGGEQQRVAIARAIVKHPSLLLADEPTGNLDPANSDEVVAVLDRVNKNGTTLVMATHDHHLVDRLQRRVIELSDGVLVRDSHGGYVGATQQPERIEVREPLADDAPNAEPPTQAIADVDTAADVPAEKAADEPRKAAKPAPTAKPEPLRLAEEESTKLPFASRRARREGRR